jgi:hypothetical protein
LCV